MRIAVIGAGIAGSAAAWALAVGSRHEVTLFEASPEPGGHAATVEVDYDGARIAVDTGFMVYNELTYPELTALFRHLGVATQAAPMSFSVSVDGGRYEWAGRASGRLRGFFAQPRNLVSAAHFRLLGDVIRFNRRAAADLSAGRLAGLSLGDYVATLGLSRRFADDYLLAMGAAIWSTSPARMLAFPAETFVAFCANHRLLHLDRPVWRTVTGGSRAYVSRLAGALGERLRTSSPVVALRRDAEGVEVRTADGASERFDQAILATHSDQALAILGDPSLMPHRRAAWSSWNLLKAPGTAERVGCTYWMNAIQGLDPARPLFVTLNPDIAPASALTFRTFAYAHPRFDGEAVEAQGRLDVIQGVRRTRFAGAWTGYGFHEDGLVSGLAAAEALGAVVPWRDRSPALLQAAE